MKCPGYEKKSWWSRTCKWFYSGKWGWVGSSSFCGHPDRTHYVCLTGGKPPREGFDVVGIDLDPENIPLAGCRARGHLGMLAEIITDKDNQLATGLGR